MSDREKQEINRNEKGQWEPGTSGNPKGRPPKGQSLTELMREFLEDVPEGREITYKELFIKNVITMALQGDFYAIKLIWNYIDGMPTQRVFTGELDDLKDIPKDELIKALNERTTDGSGEEGSE